ncbi:hypothetical protein OC845_005998 [Tilletia horrida]|nr:hypothetical protein OC845_005998 [Tilletia horrida]
MQTPPLLAVLSAGALLRLAVFIYAPALTANLSSRPESSTPVSSFRSLQEAVYLQALSAHTASALTRQSQSIHHSPLLVASLGRLVGWNNSHSPSTFAHTLAQAALWSLIDTLSAWALYRVSLARSRAKRRRSGTKDQTAQSSAQPQEAHEQDAQDGEQAAHQWALRVAALYLANPFNLVSCWSQSTKPLSSALTLLALQQAIEGSAFLSTLILSLGAHISLYPILQIPPLILLARQQASAKNKNSKSTLALLGAIAGLLVGLGGGTYAAWLLEGQSWKWVMRTWGSIVFLTDLTPNIGMWWYFIMEMFDHFRDFFLLVLNAHVLTYVAPFTIKYRDDPLFAFTALAGILAIFQSYPTVGDSGLFWGLAALFPELFSYMRYPLVTSLIHIYCAFLLPTFNTLWLGPGSRSGSGNANFFYAITLVYSLGGGLGLLDLCYAWGKEKWERERRIGEKGGGGGGGVALTAAAAVERAEERRIVVQM